MANKLTLKEYIKRANKFYNYKYDYSKVIYVNSSSKIIIICPLHGEFKRVAWSHINPKEHYGCPKCSKEKNTITKEKIINQFNKIHGNKYDYSLVDYKGDEIKIKIICKKHGVFEQTPSNHKRNHGCPKCKNLKNLNIFIEKSKSVHGDKYDYSKYEYFGSRTKSIIICKIHGNFLQTPDNHYAGKGCPKCNSSKGENKIELLLDTWKIPYIKEHTFKNCKGKNKYLLRFDFYIKEINTCIEFQGIQHFTGWKNSIKSLKEINFRDELKRKYCNKNNICLFEISYKENIEQKLNIIKEKYYNL